MTDTIGQKLRQARLARTLTLEQVAQETHVRVHYLQAMESNDFERIPSEAQARGFLRIYANFLGLQNEDLLPSVEEVTPADKTYIEKQPQDISAPPSVHEPAIAIFVEIGQRLKHQRELLGLSLDDVEQHTHLRKHYLGALETGTLDALPSPVQGRGMLHNYSEFLGLDTDAVLLRFAEGLQARLTASQPREPATGPRTTRRTPILPLPIRRLLSGEFLVGTFFILFLVGFMVWGAIRVFTLRDRREPAPTAPPIAEVLLAPTTAAPTSSPIPPSPTNPAQSIPDEQIANNTAEVAAPGSTDSDLVQIYITVRQRTWMRVLVDGKVEFEGRVFPGTAYQYAGEDSVEILTGNGAALQVFYAQSDLGPLGLLGEVVHLVFTQIGVQTPTPTITLTPTITPRATRTLQITPPP